MIWEAFGHGVRNLDERYKDSYSCYSRYVDIVLLEACISGLFTGGIRQRVVGASMYNFCTCMKATSFYFTIGDAVL